MGKVLTSLAFATALLAVASSQASANFVCQAVGARSVGYGRAYFVADAKWQALSGASGTAEFASSAFASSAIAFRRIDYRLKPRRNASARSYLRAVRTTRETAMRAFAKSWRRE